MKQNFHTEHNRKEGLAGLNPQDSSSDISAGAMLLPWAVGTVLFLIGLALMMAA